MNPSVTPAGLCAPLSDRDIVPSLPSRLKAKPLGIAALAVAMAWLLPAGAQAQNYKYYAPPAQTSPTTLNITGVVSGTTDLAGNQDFILNLTGDCTGSLKIHGGRHIRIKGNGHKFQGKLELMQQGGDHDAPDANVDYGSIYVEGVYFLKPWPNHTGVNIDAIWIGNDVVDTGTNKRHIDVIIQNNRFENIYGTDPGIPGVPDTGHGDCIQFQNLGAPLDVRNVYVYRNTLHSSYHHFIIAQTVHTPAYTPMVKNFFIDETNMRQFLITDGSDWANWPKKGTSSYEGAAIFWAGANAPISLWSQVYCGANNVYEERGSQGGHTQPTDNMMNTKSGDSYAPMQTSGTQLWYSHSKWWAPGRVNIGVPAGGDQITSTFLSSYSNISNFIGTWILDGANSWMPTGNWDSTKWTDTDIGSVGSAGSGTISANGDTFTVKGAGSDIGGTADSFNYMYKTMTGDCTVTVRLTNETIGGTNDDKSGIMIRETTATNSKHVSLFLVSSGTRLFSRSATGGSTTSSSITSGTSLPRWLRLQRSGTTFTGSVSTDGTNWTTVGTATVTMASSVEAGIAVCSRQTASFNTSVFDNVIVP